MMFNKNPVFWAACAGILLFGIGLITLGSVAPDLRSKFDMDELSSGTLFSIMPIGILTGSLVFGPICDKYGYKLLLIISCVLLFFGFLGIAYAPGISLLKLCVFVFGLGGGAINGATNGVVADISEEHKGAELSILGVFFGIGALGMPMLLGLMKNRLSFETILAIVAVFSLAVALFVAVIKFPEPKQKHGFPIRQSLGLIKDNLILLIAFFLFCQSSFEAIINNWTTSYLADRLNVEANDALYALSLYVAGLTAMRLLTGTFFRKASGFSVLFASFLLLLAGLLLLKTATSFTLAVVGLVLVGAGLAGGFPIMFGIVGQLYSQISGTAFSFILVIALVGNILVNYLMGLIAQRFGVQQVVNVALLELAVMTVLCVFIKRKTINKL
jgi:MFS transporter, FHS family, glucose/mannose:H+ symporter